MGKHILLLVCSTFLNNNLRNNKNVLGTQIREIFLPAKVTYSPS